MNKILVIGATGMVASKFVKEASNKAEIIGVDENTLDITDKDAVVAYFLNNDFESVINFAAYTDVDGAEKQRNDEQGFVWKLNVEAVKNLTDACKLSSKFFVQISTDFVFPGTDDFPGPYDELSPVSYNLSPNIGWYGYTKAVAESRVMSDEFRSAIVRISYPFYSDEFTGKLDFAKNYLNLYDEGKLFPIFSDQIFTPILLDELINPLTKIASEKIPGTFHLVSSNEATMYDFTKYLLKKARGVSNVVLKSSMAEFLKAEGRTPRPRLGGLKTDLTENKLGIKFKTWQEMIDRFVNELND